MQKLGLVYDPRRKLHPPPHPHPRIYLFISGASQFLRGVIRSRCESEERSNVVTSEVTLLRAPAYLAVLLTSRAWNTGSLARCLFLTIRAR